MNHVIEELKSIPGVLGAFIFHHQKGILANNLPAVFKAPKLSSIGKILVKIYSSARKNFSDLNEVSLYYEESIVMVREAAAQHFLIILSDPGVNMNLLTMSLNLIMDDLQNISDTAATVTPEPVEPSAQEASPAEDVFDTVDSLMKEGPMSEIFQGLEQSLLKIMGPMAEIIFRDAMAEWLKQGKPSQEKLPDLVVELRKEIGDEEKFIKYQSYIAPYMGSESG